VAHEARQWFGRSWKRRPARTARWLCCGAIVALKKLRQACDRSRFMGWRENCVGKRTLGKISKSHRHALSGEIEIEDALCRLPIPWSRRNPVRSVW
jgi:hypothetical protein